MAANGNQAGTCFPAGDKDSMMEAIVDRKVRQYQVSEYEKGQRATDYPTWLSSSAHYTVKFEEVHFLPQPPPRPPPLPPPSLHAFPTLP